MRHLFSASYWEQKDVEKLIGRLLRTGVVLASIVAFIGGIFYLYIYGKGQPQYHEFIGAAEPMRHMKGILQGVAQTDGAAIIQLGVVILISTPIVRVAFSALAFFIEKDYKYVLITFIVFCVIMFSMISKMGG
ncbi:DUF1634 domain-containing protein [Danxiaibacter flavus]|uniref:DUF1634 domain-containing protein n=1 Tax=Danxiaibacter flavus TaxID=3049108 RepID=A0ABV3ZN24_9BACT|nr:DUF1634 domain-containing protein [Chitinophagaceae bacterium DXS]